MIKDQRVPVCPKTSNQQHKSHQLIFPEHEVNVYYYRPSNNSNFKCDTSVDQVQQRVENLNIQNLTYTETSSGYVGLQNTNSNSSYETSNTHINLPESSYHWKQMQINESIKHERSNSNINQISKRDNIPRQQQSRDVYQEPKPRLLAKKTNDEKAIAIFGVVADINQLTEHHSVCFPDTVQQSLTREQLSLMMEPTSPDHWQEESHSQEWQLPIKTNSIQPPLLFSLPRHPFDPVEDESFLSSHNGDSLIAPNKLPGWKQKKLGAFNYLGNFGSSQSSDLSRSGDLHYNKEMERKEPSDSRQPGDDLNVAEFLTSSSTEKMMGHFSVTENNLQQNSLKHNNLLKDRLQLAKSGKAKRRPTKALSQDKLDAKASVVHHQSETKLIFNMPSKDALERDTAHPMPVTKRVWKVEGFGNTSKPKNTIGSGLISQLKAVGKGALKSGGILKGEQRQPHFPKPSADEVRIEKNAEAVMKSLDVINEARKEHCSKENCKVSGQSVSLDRSNDSLRRGRSTSHDRFSSHLEHSKSIDRALSPHHKGHLKSFDRPSFYDCQAQSKSHDKVVDSEWRSYSESQNRLSGLNQGYFTSHDRGIYACQNSSRLSDDRLFMPYDHGQSKPHDKSHILHSRGIGRSSESSNRPYRHGRSKSCDKLCDSSHHMWSHSPGRYSGTGRYLDKEDQSCRSPECRYSKRNLPSYYDNERDPRRCMMLYSDRDVTKRAWVNDPRWRQNQGYSLNLKEKHHLYGTAEQFPPKPVHRGHLPNQREPKSPYCMR